MLGEVLAGLIGASFEAIQKGEDREAPRDRRGAERSRRELRGGPQPHLPLDGGRTRWPPTTWATQAGGAAQFHHGGVGRLPTWVMSCAASCVGIAGLSASPVIEVLIEESILVGRNTNSR